MLGAIIGLSWSNFARAPATGRSGVRTSRYRQVPGLLCLRAHGGRIPRTTFNAFQVPHQLPGDMRTTLDNLPDDVLLQIFVNFKPYELDLLHATHVNSHWRALATQTPLLWRQVFCGWAKRETVPVHVAIARSASADIALVGRYASFHDIIQQNQQRVSSIRAYFSPSDDLEHIGALLAAGMPVLRTLRLVNSSNTGSTMPLDWSILNSQSVPSLRNFTTYGFSFVLETVCLPRLQITRYEVPFLADAGQAVIALLLQFPELEDLGVDLGPHCDMKHDLPAETLASLARLRRLDFEAAEDRGNISVNVAERLIRSALALPISHMVVSVQSATDEHLVNDGQVWARAAAEAYRARCGGSGGATIRNSSNIVELSEWSIIFSRGDIDQSGHDVPEEVLTLSLVASGITRTLYSSSSQRIVQLARGIFGDSCVARVVVFGVHAFDVLCSLAAVGVCGIVDLTLVLSRHEMSEIASVPSTSTIELRLPPIQRLCLRARPDEIVHVSTDELAQLLIAKLSTEQNQKPHLRTAGLCVVGSVEHLRACVIFDENV